jgi:hypothetical protein
MTSSQKSKNWTITTSSLSSRAFITDRTTTINMSVEMVCLVLQGLLNLNSDMLDQSEIK